MNQPPPNENPTSASIEPSMPCVCGSGHSYQDCCQALHTHQTQAKTAEQLMRSRYAAYCLGLWRYVYETGPGTGDAAEEQKAMSDWCADKQWLSLRILGTVAGQASDDAGQVEFIAFYRDLSGQQTLTQHHELSQFVQTNGAWQFISGEARPPVAIGRNEACPCGSGKKFKRCCQN